LDHNVVYKYICGFLNSLGGRLFFGINDDGYVKGIKMTKKDIESF